MQKTIAQYNNIVTQSLELFSKKMKDYGSAWRILRLSSLTDQIFIKAQRIRGLQENIVHKIDEDESSEFIGIINYSVIALIQFNKGVALSADMNLEQAQKAYIQIIDQARELMKNKNHDYGEAWRNMRIASFTDLILQKLLRIKQIEDNQGLSLVSEGVDANYLDIINYAIFALILIDENPS